jgi:tetratricopeptide (TPR) repeat protein
MVLEPPDTHYLLAALGWMELGNLAEAKAELGRITPALQAHPDVLEAGWLICAQGKQWEEALVAARALVEVAPERASGWLHRAYALRRVADGGLQRAWDALLPAQDKFPGDSTIAYNLSCYACQLKQLDAARLWLKRAMEIGEREPTKQMALADPDLEALWAEIREL